MKRDALTDLWKQWCDRRIPDTEVPQGELMSLIQSRANDVQRRVNKRLRQEISYYFICIGVTLPQFLYKPGAKTLGFFGVFIVLQGILIFILHRKSREMALAQPTGSTLQWIDELSDRLRQTSRSYLQAYMLFVGVSVTLIAVVLAVKMSWSFWAYVVIAAAVGAISLTYWAGRRYVECMFGRYRNELLGYRRQLLEQ
jgi:hypothetical protein